MALDPIALLMANSYTDETVGGAGGTLKGKNCTIQSITPVDGGNNVVFSWTADDGTVQTSTMFVADGTDGRNGVDGVSVTHTWNGTTLEVTSASGTTSADLKGETGSPGAQGLQGLQGEKGDTGNTGADGISPTITENADNAEDVYKLDITDIHGTRTTPNLVGRQGAQGIQGERGEKGDTGERGLQGIQGIQGEKGNDGYPFLIYKEYTDISEFNASDFPEIGLMFMINDGVAGTNRPVYRYTGAADTPYSHVTDLTTSEGLKGDKGDKGDQGEQGVPGETGAPGVDGITYTPKIGLVQTVEATQDANATVEIDGDNHLATFNFWLPRGAVGQQGLQGDKGEQGEKGTDGTTYTPAIGTIETVDSALSATASVEVDADAKTAKFNFAIPKGVGVEKIEFTASTGGDTAGIAGATDTYTITYTDGTTGTYEVYNGADGAVIADDVVSEDSTWSSQKLYSRLGGETNTITTLDNRGQSAEKWFKLLPEIKSGQSYTVKMTGQRINASAEIEYLSVTAYTAGSEYRRFEFNRLLSQVYASGSGKPSKAEACFLVLDANWQLLVHVPSYAVVTVEFHRTSTALVIDEAQTTAPTGTLVFDGYSAT